MEKQEYCRYCGKRMPKKGNRFITAQSGAVASGIMRLRMSYIIFRE